MSTKVISAFFAGVMAFAVPAAAQNGQGYGGGHNGSGIYTGNNNGGGEYRGGYDAGGGFRGQTTQIRCESLQFKQVACPIDARGGVRLLQQTGGTCVRGQTWGFSSNGIWVNNGCRALFAVVGGRPGFGPGPGDGPPGGGGFPAAGIAMGERLVVCESRRFQPQRCSTDIYGRPQIVEILGGDCTQGRTWGWDRGGIWVNNGCRARFRLG